MATIIQENVPVNVGSKTLLADLVDLGNGEVAYRLKFNSEDMPSVVTSDVPVSILSQPLLADLVDLGSGVSAYALKTSGGGGGGSSILEGTVADLPAPGAAGTLYLPDDGFYIYRDTGVAWNTWGPIFPLEPQPVLADFAWGAQGGATASAANGGIYISKPGGGAGTDNFSYFTVPLPDVPYTATLGYLPLLPLSTSPAIFPECGLTLTVDSPASTLGQVYFGSEWRASGPGPGLFLSSYPISIRQPPSVFGFVFVRIQDDGVNRIYSFSADGVNFTTIGFEGRTVGITPTRAGLYVDGNADTTMIVGMTALHFEITTP